jgi:protein-S-isoprenylcysteine O-methyltransferase Ste14
VPIHIGIRLRLRRRILEATSLYKQIRHPLMAGFITAMWAMGTASRPLFDRGVDRDDGIE